MKVYISKSKFSGKGLFAKKDIKRNKVIFTVKGKIIKGTYGKEYWIGSRWLSIGNRLWVNPYKNSLWWFINHSCNPNSGLKGKKEVVAMRNIKKDEEITIDYSITEDDPYWKMKCRCGNKNCRKIIRSIRFLPKKLFKKYYNYTPKFLKNSYFNHNLK